MLRWSFLALYQLVSLITVPEKMCCMFAFIVLYACSTYVKQWLQTSLFPEPCTRSCWYVEEQTVGSMSFKTIVTQLCVLYVRIRSCDYYNYLPEMQNRFVFFDDSTVGSMSSLFCLCILVSFTSVKSCWCLPVLSHFTSRLQRSCCVPASPEERPITERITAR